MRTFETACASIENLIDMAENYTQLRAINEFIKELSDQINSQIKAYSTLEELNIYANRLTELGKIADVLHRKINIINKTTNN